LSIDNIWKSRLIDFCVDFVITILMIGSPSNGRQYAPRIDRIAVPARSQLIASTTKANLEG
jgi:hypothetical protein